MSADVSKRTPGPWMRPLSTRRFWQLAEIADRAPTERVANHIRASKAFGIGNRSAGAYFTCCANQWERIRVMADRALMRDMDARAALASLGRES